MCNAKFITTFVKNDTLIKLMEFFSEKSNCNILIERREHFLFYLYGVTRDELLINSLRYQKFGQSAMKTK